MAAALIFISQMTNRIFEAQMRRAASRISARQQLFPHHG
jgi:hypothetical protein